MELGERVATLETEMKTALEGVGNFRNFQVEMRQFTTAHQAREEERMRIEAQRAAAEEHHAKSVDRSMKRVVTAFTVVVILLMVGNFLFSAFGPEIRKDLHLPALEYNQRAQFSSGPPPSTAGNSPAYTYQESR